MRFEAKANEFFICSFFLFLHLTLLAIIKKSFSVSQASKKWGQWPEAGGRDITELTTVFYLPPWHPHRWLLPNILYRFENNETFL